jgi:hypothetical protein
MTNPVVGTVVPLTINVHSDTLEVVMSTMKRAGVVLDALTAERDELLSALKAVAHSCESAEAGIAFAAGKPWERPRFVGSTALEAARMLIAKHEGKEENGRL